MTRAITLVLALALMTPAPASAQVPPDVWRSFVESVDVGTELNVRLQDGTRFRAILVGTRDSVVLLQPRTRLPVPVQPVPYDAIAGIERRQGGGIGAGKAAAIGVASGVGAFFVMLIVAFALISD